jgi:hypothetical protein
VVGEENFLALVSCFPANLVAFQETTGSGCKESRVDREDEAHSPCLSKQGSGEPGCPAGIYLALIDTLNLSVGSE